jgi:hypothetical protein
LHSLIITAGWKTCQAQHCVCCEPSGCNSALNKPSLAGRGKIEQPRTGCYLVEPPGDAKPATNAWFGDLASFRMPNIYGNLCGNLRQ